MTKTEERKVDLPTCKINKGTIEDVCNLMEMELQKLKKLDKDAHAWLTFEIESKSKNIKADTTKSLFDSKFPRNLEEIHLHLHYNSYDNDDERNISLWIHFSSWSSSYFRVEGIDSNWVSGITSRLEEIFEENKNINRIFRNLPTQIPIVIGIVFFLGLGVTFLALSYFPEIYDEDDHPLELTVIVMIATFFPFYAFLNWLFPHVEFENYLIQTRIRKIALSGIGTLIIGLIIAGLIKLIF